MEAIIKSFFAVFISFLVTFYVTPLFSALARKLQFVDVPDGKIKLHKNAVPYLGGLAVYCGFIVSLALVFPIENNILLFLIGSTLLLFVGLVDDLFVLKPYQKFFGQIIAAFCFLKAGFYLKEHFFYTLWHIPLSVLWILSIINAFNLVDVMDGLASLLAIAATSSFMVISFYFNHNTSLLLLASLLGSLMAFFWYNKPSATIYLGDAGSLFIGGLVATIPFLLPWGLYNWHGYLTPLVVLLIPFLEIGALILIRTYRGIPFYKGSPDHFSHYLLRKGWKRAFILGYIALLSIIQMLIARLFVAHIINLDALVVSQVIFIIFWFFTLFLGKKTPVA
ncbi:undecaprenyl/decaprenyl-phosphate alpha-N-acetylglucosaminyl 1-phosphate transferase [Candidatus Dependentiae bacterium]|nr:undecaprenyl/decaprenyl-phosphate alpha-N-acetylglucosaminyl 1-phosphate transferase [Candidatus Dependentiae bacterium]